MDKDTKYFVLILTASVMAAVAIFLYIMSHHREQTKIMVRIEQPNDLQEKKEVKSYSVQNI